MQPAEPIGRLAELDAGDRLRAIGCVEDGQVWALGTEIFGRREPPGFPDRPTQLHIVYRDWSDYQRGRAEPLPGGLASVDDGALLNCHGGSHLDAPGHVIIDGSIAGGYDAATTIGGLEHADVASVARVGIVCRGVLLDLCRILDDDQPLPRDHHVTLDELQECMARHGVEAARGDMLLCRTGTLGRYRVEKHGRLFEDFSEPGLTHDPELLEWVDATGVLGIGTDTLSNEMPRCPSTGEEYPLHRYLLFERGLQFHEALWLDDLAAACASDGRYVGLYIASPLKLVGASGSPINPLFIK